MGITNLYKSVKEKAKQHNIVLLISLIYNFVWAICKILVGVFNQLYFFSISGASTLLFGFIKRVYLKNYKNDDVDERIGKSITISILLMVSSALFAFYMARLFFISETKQYGIIMSIAIATFSFVDLVLSIFNYVKVKESNDILLISFKECSMVSSCYAITLTQVALLSATQTPANFYNALTGTILGVLSICIGLHIFISALKYKKSNK